MEVILLQKVANLGNIGDRVKVRSGYGRNFLLPQGKATLVTPSNVVQFEARRAELENIARSELDSAQQRAAALQEFKLTITAKVLLSARAFKIASSATFRARSGNPSVHRLRDSVGNIVVKCGNCDAAWSPGPKAARLSSQCTRAASGWPIQNREAACSAWAIPNIHG